MRAEGCAGGQPARLAPERRPFVPGRRFSIRSGTSRPRAGAHPGPPGRRAVGPDAGSGSPFSRLPAGFARCVPASPPVRLRRRRRRTETFAPQPRGRGHRGTSATDSTSPYAGRSVLLRQGNSGHPEPRSSTPLVRAPLFRSEIFPPWLRSATQGMSGAIASLHLNLFISDLPDHGVDDGAITSFHAHTWTKGPSPAGVRTHGRRPRAT